MSWAIIHNISHWCVIALWADAFKITSWPLFWGTEYVLCGKSCLVSSDFIQAFNFINRCILTWGENSQISLDLKKWDAPIPAVYRDLLGAGTGVAKKKKAKPEECIKGRQQNKAKDGTSLEREQLETCPVLHPLHYKNIKTPQTTKNRQNEPQRVRTPPRTAAIFWTSQESACLVIFSAHEIMISITLVPIPLVFNYLQSGKESHLAMQIHNRQQQRSDLCNFVKILQAMLEWRLLWTGFCLWKLAEGLETWSNCLNAWTNKGYAAKSRLKSCFLFLICPLKILNSITFWFFPKALLSLTYTHQHIYTYTHTKINSK